MDVQGERWAVPIDDARAYIQRTGGHGVGVLDWRRAQHVTGPVRLSDLTAEVARAEAPPPPPEPTPETEPAAPKPAAKRKRASRKKKATP